MLKSEFEERARTWRAQAIFAAQARKTADHSAHFAEELEEHAEEEREAAQLRHVARENPFEAVEKRGSQRESVEAQAQLCHVAREKAVEDVEKRGSQIYFSGKASKPSSPKRIVQRAAAGG